MRPFQLPAQSEEQLQALAELYRTTHNVRLRTRAQMVLLAAEQHLRPRRSPPLCARVKTRSAAGSNGIRRKGSRDCRMHGQVERPSR